MFLENDVKSKISLTFSLFFYIFSKIKASRSVLYIYMVCLNALSFKQMLILSAQNLRKQLRISNQVVFNPGPGGPPALQILVFSHQTNHLINSVEDVKSRENI